MRRDRIIFRQRKGDRQTPRPRPPRIAATPSAGELMAGEHDRWGEQFIAAA